MTIRRFAANLTEQAMAVKRDIAIAAKLETSSYGG